MMQKYLASTRMHPSHPGLEALEDGFCMLDADWRVTYWNRSAERLTGIRRERMLGSVLWERLPAWRTGRGFTELEAVRVERLPRRYLEAVPGAPPLSVHAAPAGDGVLALHFREAGEEVRRAEPYAGLLESIRDGFLAVDQSWTVVYFNAMAESLLRLPRERALGVSFWSLLPRGSSAVADCVRATMADGVDRHLREVEVPARPLRGKIFDLWTCPLPGGGLSVLFEDVSDRVRREGDLARLAMVAQEANEAKSRFFAAISHELRTPLNAIVGYTHLLGTGTYGELPAGAQRAAERASVCAEHLSRLVDDVLLLTTAEVGRLLAAPRPIRLDMQLPGILEPLMHQAQAKGLDFHLCVEPELQAETDPQRLRQLLVALVGNAVRFTSRGGVRVSAAVLPPESCVESDESGYSLFPSPQVEILICDTGPGIAPEHRERIFGPFEQLGDPSRSDSINRGTGLGLTIARQLCGVLRGSLDLAETGESGSTFRIRLPVCFPADPPAPAR
jgi:signal transduction histidine kinase